MTVTLCSTQDVLDRVGENANVITNNETGLLIGPSRVDELEKAILELLANIERIVNLGEKARERVVKHYSSEIMTKRYCELYDSVIGSRVNY